MQEVENDRLLGDEKSVKLSTIQDDEDDDGLKKRSKGKPFKLRKKKVLRGDDIDDADDSDDDLK